MKKLIVTIVLIAFSFSCFSLNEKHKIYDSVKNEFYVNDLKISDGVCSFLENLYNEDAWVIDQLVWDDDWYLNPFMKYEIVHWCTFTLNKNISKERYVSIIKKLFGDLSVIGFIDDISKFTANNDYFNNILKKDLNLKIDWYQNGQIKSIEIWYDDINELSKNARINGEPLKHNLYQELNSIYDSIFPSKEIANKMYGHFQYYGIKNVKTYITDCFIQYTFDEVTYEKYKNYDVKSVLDKFLK